MVCGCDVVLKKSNSKGGIDVPYLRVLGVWCNLSVSYNSFTNVILFKQRVGTFSSVLGVITPVERCVAKGGDNVADEFEEEGLGDNCTGFLTIGVERDLAGLSLYIHLILFDSHL